MRHFWLGVRLGNYVAKLYRYVNFAFVLQLHKLATYHWDCSLTIRTLDQFRWHSLVFFSIYKVNKKCISKLGVLLLKNIFFRLPGSDDEVPIPIASKGEASFVTIYRIKSAIRFRGWYGFFFEISKYPSKSLMFIKQISQWLSYGCLVPKIHWCKAWRIW